MSSMELGGLVDSFGSVRRASAFLRGLVGAQRWDDVRRERSADLLVYLALARFRGRPRLSGLPPALQWDIRSLVLDLQVRLRDGGYAVVSCR